MTTRAQLQSKSIDELRQIAGAVGIETDGLQKSKLISALVDAGQVADPSPAEEVDLPQATPRTERAGQDGEAASDQESGDEPRPESRQGGRPDYDDQRQGGTGIATGAGVAVAVAARTSTSPRKISRPARGLLDILPEGYGFLRSHRVPLRRQGRLRLRQSGAQVRAPQGRHRRRARSGPRVPTRSSPPLSASTRSMA